MIAQSVIAVASVIALFALAWAIRRIADRFLLSAESQRKAVHVGVGIHAMTLPLLLTRDGFLIFAVLAAAALLVLRIPGIASDGIGASLHSVQRRSWGDFLFLLAVSLLFVLTPGNPALYTLPIAVLTLSDAAAALIGTEYGKLRFGGDDRIKSVEGSATFFVVTWITCVIILLLETEIPRQNVLLLATLVGAFATYVEAASWRGLDNLFVPVGIYVLLFTWANSPPLILAAVTVGWLLFLLAAEVAAPRFGMTPHAARSAAVALFLTVIVVQPINAVMPVLAFFAALLARPSGDDTEMILDFVATLVLTGVAWLITGNVLGVNAIAFYAASFAAIGAGYTGYALRETNYRIVGGIAAAAAVCLVYWLLLPGMIQYMGWVPAAPLIGFVVFVTSVTVLTEVLRPKHWSTRNPGLRLAVTALVLLVPVYLYEVLQ
ncbi:diacylglycerol/polyprenol kinase family protein [Roseibium sp.]|uniref:diacylglycerol/polyprenol kinase family protein n=1 Tax=Roseibium sp. TaxID=1936156 RepID=UPI003BB1CCCA